MAKQTVTLKLTSSIAVQGAILKRGQLVEVSENEAQSLLHRGKAELATVADEPEAQEPAAEETEQDEAPAEDEVDADPASKTEKPSKGKK
jgi:hypothetical protein